MMRLIAFTSAAALALVLTLPLRAQDEPQSPKETVRAYSLRVTGDGHVELTVKENAEDKVYKADSMEEFVREHPDVARKYGIGRGRMPTWNFPAPGEFAKKFEEWRNQFGDLDAFRNDPDLQRFLEHSAPQSEPAPQGIRLGIRLAPLSQVLADQLGLDAKAGTLIVDVETGSMAEKAGLKKNDVLVKIDGKDAAGTDAARSAVQDALKKKDFSIEVLRQGKRQMIPVHVQK